MRRGLASSALLIVAMAVLARAGATTPTLVVQAANALPFGIGSGRLIAFTVSYDHANAVQADYDLELIVYQGASFARFPVSGDARTGTSAVLLDGLAASDLPALDTAATPAPAGVRLVTFEPALMRVTLPESFASSSGATALLAATVDEGVVLSNPLLFTVP